MTASPRQVGKTPRKAVSRAATGGLASDRDLSRTSAPDLARQPAMDAAERKSTPAEGREAAYPAVIRTTGDASGANTAADRLVTNATGTFTVTDATAGVAVAEATIGVPVTDANADRSVADASAGVPVPNAVAALPIADAMADVPVAGAAGKAAAPAQGIIEQPASGQPVAIDQLPAEDRNAFARVTIDIDPVIAAGFIQGRLHLALRGRVRGAELVDEVALHMDGQLVGRMQFPTPPLGEDPPTQRAFRIAYPQRAGAADGERHCVVSAHTAQGSVHQAQFTLAVAARAPTPVTIRAGAAVPASAYPAIRTPIVLCVERAEQDGQGRLHLHGWCVAETRVVTVQLFVGEDRIGAAKTGLDRADVGAFYPDYPHSGQAGFVLNQSGAADHAIDVVRVQAICHGGASCEVVVPVERAASPDIAAHCSTPANDPGASHHSASVEVRPPEAGGLVPDHSQGDAYPVDHSQAEPREAGLVVAGSAVAGALEGRLREPGIPGVGVPEGDATRTRLPKAGRREAGLPDPGEAASGRASGEAASALARGEAAPAMPRGDAWATAPGNAALRRAPAADPLAEDVEATVRVPTDAVPAPPPAASPPGQAVVVRAPLPYRMNQGFALAANAVPTVAVANASLLPFTDTASPDPGRNIHFFCDEVAVTSDHALLVSGWAVSGVGISEILVQLNGQVIGEADIGLLRPDVGAEFATIPMARRSGFRFEQPLPPMTAGEHNVTVIVRNGTVQREEQRRIIVDEIPATPRSIDRATDAASEFRFELDSPRVTDGVVLDPITGRLTVEGWVLARSGVAGIDVLLDGQRLGEAHHGLARQDVGAAFPDWDNALRSGYAFHCPPRVLKDGAHEMTLLVRAGSGEEHAVRFAFEVARAADGDDLGGIRRRAPRAELDLTLALLADLGIRPRFHLVLLNQDGFDAERLMVTLDGLRRQIYPDWTATVLARPAEADAIRGLISAWDEELVGRIRVAAAGEPDWDRPLIACADTGVLCGVIGAGDELGADALAEIALAAALHRGTQLVYADEVRVSPASQSREPFFKPDWSPDLLLSTNYIGRPWFAAASLLQSIGATPLRLWADGEYDLLLRLTERAATIRHVPKLLAQRGMPVTADPVLLEGERAALGRALARRGTPGEIMQGWSPGAWRARRTGPVRGKVSVIIPTCAAKGYIRTCLDTLRARTAYRDFETVVIDNIPADQPDWKAWLADNADRVVDIPEAFNWSRFNNTAVAACDGEFLLFLNDDIEIVQDDWLDAMLEHMVRPEVGIVGARLLYPDRKVQHAGMFLGTNGVGRHAFRFAAEDEPGYFGLALTQRNVIAVTGACMLVRRTVFERLGRFDELHTIVNNDLDFCLRAHQAGLLTVFTPHATLVHHELASRDKLKDVFDLTHFDAHWKTLFAAGDPYFSPLLSRHADDYRPDDEPVQIVHAGHPLFRPDDIRRILVVKLDHIGDFVTALPAIRHLKRSFPRAWITVLAGRASQAFVDCEPAIDELIPFDFFHSRSQLGERELTEADFLELRTQLKPYRFDLAVDLRKHLSTRDVLKYTGAQYLAGFDYMGQFPFLDIALEWDGDRTLLHKRGHVVDDLLALAQAVANAGSEDRALIRPNQPAASDEALPDAVRPLFERPVVAVHAGAGNVTKQWPEAHVVALIDLLIERDGVNVVMVGGPDDEAVSETIIARVARPGRIGSMAGRTKLSALPGLLVRCALYIGNDSGPKHIAAGLGVPTIGIHSGVVDATEWGPVGPRAVALRRNMTCSPCYLANAADCPRDLACLRLLEPALVHQAAQALLARPVKVLAALADATVSCRGKRAGKAASSGSKRGSLALQPGSKRGGSVGQPGSKHGGSAVSPGGKPNDKAVAKSRHGARETEAEPGKVGGAKHGFDQSAGGARQKPRSRPAASRVRMDA